MKEYISVIAAIVAGFFAILTWRLKHSADENVRKSLLEKERRDELKNLYADIGALIEKSITQVLALERWTLAEEFAKANARLRLLAPQDVIDQYSLVADLMQKWSSLYTKSMPEKHTDGDRSYLIIRSPDPREKYRKPAEEAHVEMQRELAKLIKLMRDNVAKP
ncbi:hypothetical protein [Polyangium sp. y55x31]|uniref:hypothetical protein n=1 Tax=Polyangium sp. y55x31 TaxID=3042688 RepID=UPI002482DBD0|nr:hypothetical protein [Polyangium sp. y55x31]MDI1484502.1 hypothetical protein [Polyangium sp. y55x31]